MKHLIVFLIFFESICGYAQNQPINYLESAEKAMNNQEWSVADSILTIGTNTNPHQGEIWFQLARVKYKLAEYRGAVKAYLTTDSLGYGKKWVALGLAYAYWSLGEQVNAAKWFETLVSIDPSWINKIQNDKLKLFLGDIDYYRIVGKKLDSESPRKDRWRQDLLLLQSALKRSHYDVNAKSNDQEWDSLYKKIYSEIPSMSDKEVALEFAKYVALAGDGHTNIWPQFYDYEFQMLPVLIYPFSEGFFIRAAASQYHGSVGGKLLKIGNMKIEEVYKRVSDFVGHDNAMHEQLVFPVVVSTVEILQKIGAIQDPASISLTIQKDGEVVDEQFMPIPWDYDLLGRRREASQWHQMYAPDDIPLYLSKPNNYYWSHLIPGADLMYMQINQIRNKEDESFGEFIKKSFSQIDSLRIKNLVIDIRLNDGGDTEIYKPLILELIKSPINQKGQLFTIIGRMTYSAAMNLAVDLEYWTETTFVGEPTSSSPVFIGENKAFFLPNSGLRVSISDRKHQRGAGSSNDKRTWIAPDIFTPLSSAHFKNGIDPALAEIIGTLKAVN